MKVGTKSVLFGAHCFFLHPWFVAWAWWKLYRFPWDPRLWVAFFVHDLGYWGMEEMDDEKGEMHPWPGALVMSRLFDRGGLSKPHRATIRLEVVEGLGPWGRLSLLHSRFLSKRYGRKPSRLCMADKLAIALTPAWLYIPMASATGEIREYMAKAKSRNLVNSRDGKYATMNVYSADKREWYRSVQDYVRRYVEEHRDGREDTWTPDVREAVDDAGVWK